VCKAVSCPISVDALPQATTVYELAKAGKSAKRVEELRKAGVNPANLPDTDAEILNVRTELGATPTLYERTSARRSRSAVERDEQASLRDRQPQDERKASGDNP
jgi:hypothetical protein